MFMNLGTAAGFRMPAGWIMRERGDDLMLVIEIPLLGTVTSSSQLW